MLLARHETVETLEVVDEQGRPMGSVTLPSDPRLFGSEKGTVYLNRPLPHLPEHVSPAHAA
ncbi:MAG TPA: hypothetical protein VGP87_14200 [Gemmatimonadales bacterium]|jgi:hypothetical protein|nr:hypothetical protein [Gemmatimonadales bacterium]